MIKTAPMIVWVCALACPCWIGAKELSFASQAYMIVTTVEKYHYSPRPLDRRLSKAVYESFLRMLDPYGTFFTAESIGYLDTFKFSLEDQIKERKTAFLEQATLVYAKQLHIVDSLLQGLKNVQIDLTANDTLWLGGDTVYGKQFFLSKKLLQWIKYRILLSLQAGGNSEDAPVLPSKDEIRKALDDVIARETCRIQLRMNTPGGIEGFTGLCYLKAIASAYDPHTVYLSPAEEKLYETDLLKESGSFGIQMNFNATGEIEVVEVAPGGPAWNSNLVNEGDVLLDIKNPDGTSLDLRCATLSDVQGFLAAAGDKKTGFRIRKKSGKIVNVPLKKDVLDVEENTVRSYLLRGNTTVGYICLPSFYADFNYEGYFSKGCANDFARELIKLKSTPINGLILDLRSNGGGSLNEAIRIAGSFIDYGALCIIHLRGKGPETIKDNARGTIYDGPLVVLVNSSSASASELLAGVLQDYNRAVIVGSRTFGKSTMQDLLPVDAGKFDSLSHYKGEPPGFLTLTTGSFYRVTGASHQKAGITPDIELPELFEKMQEGEASYDGALELGSVNKKAYYYPLSSLPVNRLKNRCERRLKNSRGFKYVMKSQALVHKTGSSFPVSLAFKSFAGYVSGRNETDDSLTVDSCPFTTALPEYCKSRSTLTDRDKTGNEIIMANIRGDMYINEAFAIINDLMDSSMKKEDK